MNLEELKVLAIFFFAVILWGFVIWQFIKFMARDSLNSDELRGG